MRVLESRGKQNLMMICDSKRMMTAVVLMLLVVSYWIFSNDHSNQQMLYASKQAVSSINNLEESGGNNGIQQNKEGETLESVVTTMESEESETAYLADAGEFTVENFDPTVWVLIFLFNVALAVSIERAWFLYKNRGNNSELVNVLTKELTQNSSDYSQLMKTIKDKKYGMEGRVAAKTMEGWSYGQNAMSEFSKAALGAENRALDKRLVILSTLGNNTPFIGLLGTVLGIMKAFRDLALVGDAGPSVVMKGISEALIATAFGLGVAIPCVIAFNVFSKQVKNRLSNAQEIVDMLSGLRSVFERKDSDDLSQSPLKVI
ncbi:MAG: MotA/TolQ/ExbB proton channel family protein [Spirochaetota bacterium]|nr:MotA/TolQ/ExbB proton channel family protein [Spirochaetota bacterium]